MTKQQKTQERSFEKKSWNESFPNVPMLEHFVGVAKNGKLYKAPETLSEEEKKALDAFANFLAKRDAARDTRKSGHLMEQITRLKKEISSLSEGLDVKSLQKKFTAAPSKDIQKQLSSKIMRRTTSSR